jgi:hypothetical protein
MEYITENTPCEKLCGFVNLDHNYEIRRVSTKENHVVLRCFDLKFVKNYMEFGRINSRALDRPGSMTCPVSCSDF